MLKHTYQLWQYIYTRKLYVDFVGEHVELRLDQHKKLNKLCKDYELYSPNLDGSIQEILDHVNELAENDCVFFERLFKGEKAGLQALIEECKEIFGEYSQFRSQKLDWGKCDFGSIEPKACEEVTNDGP